MNLMIFWDDIKHDYYSILILIIKMMHQSTLLDQTKLQQIHSLLQRAVDSKDSSSQK
jgi:hypothetical protein